MKPEQQTPRDLLLARHAAANPQLDVLRRAALPRASFTLREILGELFLPHRPAWRTLAAIWLALALFHLSFGRRAQARSSPPLPPEVAAAWLAEFSSHEAVAQIDLPR